MKSTGKVYLVGAGPGDASLITLRGKSLIERCDVLIMDQLVSPEYSRWVKEGCEVLLMGKGRNAMPSVAQKDIEATMIERAGRGLHVVRLKGGDPFIFGRGGEELESLHKASIPFEIVPGVTAALAAAGSVGIPLTHRSKSSSLVFLTGHEDPEKEETRIRIQEYAQRDGTLCIYMGMSKLDSLVKSLLDAGMDAETPAAAIQWAFTPRQKTVDGTLGSLVDLVSRADLQSPAVIFIGEVVGREPSWNWFEARPLFGKRILITRSRSQCSQLRALLEAEGAWVMEVPMIDIHPVRDPKQVSEALAEIATYDWLVFTSPNGVRHFFDIFKKAYRDIRSIGGARIAAIGHSTAREIQKENLEVDIIPEEAVAESLGRALVETNSLPSAMVLVVTGNRNRDVLAEILEKDGEAIVDTLQVYETRRPTLENNPDLETLREMGADYAVFTSSSTVEHFAEMQSQLIPEESHVKPVPVSIGMITTRALESHGMTGAIEAEHASLESLVHAILTHARGNGVD